jgi:hypothetical protein
MEAQVIRPFSSLLVGKYFATATETLENEKILLPGTPYFVENSFSAQKPPRFAKSAGA